MAPPVVAAVVAMAGCGHGKPVDWVDPCNGACVAGEVCWAGTCVPESACVTPYVACAYSDEALGCTDVRDDPFNCGGCGLQCLGGVCLEGVCRAGSNSCAGAGLSECVDAGGHAYCAFLDSDQLDCGACGNACDVGAGDVGAAGACQPASTICDELGLTSCPTGCSDLVSDPYNCGECGNVCMFGCNGLGACR
ncbi:MAG: hypothetical protein HY906_21615 [Deltaproteobacteria bacterium]|nr:hypothetical protein [Deltaproteobacteria bacterium]